MISVSYGEETLEDIPIVDFQGATLTLEPASGQASRSVSPSSTYIQNINKLGESNKSNFNKKSDESGQLTQDETEHFTRKEGFDASYCPRPVGGIRRRASWHADTEIDSGLQEFFSVRVGALDCALDECRQLLVPEIDGDAIGLWLLTEINHWDIERERVVILCDNTILIVKYDFIALRHADMIRVYLNTIDKISMGELSYPSQSLVPRISGIAGGVMTVIKGCLLSRLHTTMSSITAKPVDGMAIQDKNSTSATMNRSESANEPTGFSMSSISFEPRNRNMHGLRLSWTSGNQISFTQKWNPFCRDIPYTTFTSHPIYWYTGCENSTYDVKDFSKQLSQQMEKIREQTVTKKICEIEHSQIIIENYIGIASLLHNATELGFFKLRGKVSF